MHMVRPMPKVMLEHSSPPFMKALYLILSLSSFVLTYFGLAIDWQYVALCVGSSIAGSLVFGYVRPELTFWRQAVKGCMATIVGLIFGSAVIEWQGIEKPEYIGLAYFSASLLALILIRTLVGLFETNAGSLTVTLIQRVFNIRLEGEASDLAGKHNSQKKRKEGK